MTSAPRVIRKAADPAAKERAAALQGSAGAALSAWLRQGRTPHQRRVMARALLRAAVSLAARECGAAEAASLCGQIAGRTWGPQPRRAWPAVRFTPGDLDT